MDFQGGAGGQQFQDGAAAADLDVVGVGAQAENRSDLIDVQGDHGGNFVLG